MIDIHSHIIFDIDDGPSKIDESVKMVCEAEKLGIRAIIATPHFHENLFNTEKLTNNFEDLSYRVRGHDVDLRIGYEVFLSPSIPEMIKRGVKLTLNNSMYMLVEFPFNDIPVYSHEVLYRMQLKGIIPVIAHPERNRRFAGDINSLLVFKNSGCLIQLDAASIAGVYGSTIKNFTKKLIRLNAADFVASDAHYAKDYEEWYIQAYKNVLKWAGVEYVSKVFYDNSRGIVNNTFDLKELIASMQITGTIR